MILILHTCKQGWQLTSLKEREEGKCQLAVALNSKCVKDTTVLLVKPKHDAPFISTKVPAIQGISNSMLLSMMKRIKKQSFS